MPTEDEEKTTSEATESTTPDATPVSSDAVVADLIEHHVAQAEDTVHHGKGSISAKVPSVDVDGTAFEGAKFDGAFAGLGSGVFHPAASASSEEESEVHTEVLREKAARGEAAIKELYEIIESMREKVAASEGYWHGYMAETFRERVTIGLKKFESELDAIAGYPRELIAYADMHDGVITKANAIASGVEGVEWPEEV